MPRAITLPYETRPDKKPLSSESFFAVRANCGTRVNDAGVKGPCLNKADRKEKDKV
jgi:hypothetical protein